ncbi:hypothetical protein DFJ73DRAFT_784776, partial [Zopfochytrium polystomum]
PTYAKNFAMAIENNYIVIKTAGAGPTYVLYLCNIAKPNVTVPDSSIFLQVPINNIAVSADGIVDVH